MARTVNVGEAKAKLSHLIARAEAGEEVTIARDGVPAVRIVPVKGPLSETIALMRRERAQRPQVSAMDIRSARIQHRR